MVQKSLLSILKGRDASTSEISVLVRAVVRGGMMRHPSWSRVPKEQGGLTQSCRQPSTVQPKPVSRAGEEPTSQHPSALGSVPLCCVLRRGCSPTTSRDLPGTGRGLPLKIMEIHIGALLILKRQVSFDP